MIPVRNGWRFCGEHRLGGSYTSQIIRSVPSWGISQIDKHRALRAARERDVDVLMSTPAFLPTWGSQNNDVIELKALNQKGTANAAISVAAIMVFAACDLVDIEGLDAGACFKMRFEDALQSAYGFFELARNVRIFPDILQQVEE
jgi:hypothetical protein